MISSSNTSPATSVSRWLEDLIHRPTDGTAGGSLEHQEHNHETHPRQIESRRTGASAATIVVRMRVPVSAFQFRCIHLRLGSRTRRCMHVPRWSPRHQNASATVGKQSSVSPHDAKL